MGILAISGSMISDVEYGLVVVTGLPAETYQKNDALRKEIRKSLSGTHKYTLDGKHWRTCHIDVVAVAMEGAGALVAYGSKDGGAFASATIDIGGRTTDLYVARKNIPMTEYCQGKPIGVQTATDMVMESFEAAYGIPLTALEAREIMHAWVASQQAAKAAEEAVAKEAKAAEDAAAGKSVKKKKVSALPKKPVEYPEITVNGTRIDPKEIDRFVEEAIKATAGQIASFVSSSWRQSDSTNSVAARFNPVVCIGGGAYYFYEVLKTRIPHLRMPSDPVFANSRGYAQSAARALERKQKKA
jgi:hypothetical protein